MFSRLNFKTPPVPFRCRVPWPRKSKSKLSDQFFRALSLSGFSSAAVQTEACFKICHAECPDESIIYRANSACFALQCCHHSSRKLMWFPCWKWKRLREASSFWWTTFQRGFIFRPALHHDLFGSSPDLYAKNPELLTFAQGECRVWTSLGENGEDVNDLASEINQSINQSTIDP